MKIAYLMKMRPEARAFIPADVEPIVIHTDADGRYREDELAALSGVEALVVSMEPANAQIMDACPGLRIIQRTGVGYETLDLEEAARRGIPCCNTPGVNREAVAEHAMALLLSLAKRLRESERQLRALDWVGSRRETNHAFELKGKTLGIVGLGNSGSSLAMRARAFEMQLLYTDIREIDAAVVEAAGAREMPLAELLAAADVVSINTNLNPTSRNLIDAAALATMKPGALLICCARGGVLDEAAVAAALHEGRLAAAGIDVFADEPLLPDNPLLNTPNTLLTPHVAGSTAETTARIYAWAHENVRRVLLRGERPRWVLNGV